MKTKIGIISFFLSCLLFGTLTLKPLHAQSNDAALILPAVQQFFDNNGNPLSGGKVYFYEVGTTTFKATYTSSDATTVNQNPITLNAGGKAPTGGIWGIGLYRQVVKDKNGNQIWDAVTETAGGGTTPTAIGDGNAVGTILPWSGISAPSQYVFAYGQEISRTAFPEFFTAVTQSISVICSASSNILTGISDTTQIRIGSPVEIPLCVVAGTTVVSKTSSTVTLSNSSSVSINTTAIFFPYGNGDGSTTINTPDLRGYVLAGRDNMGGTASSRLTSTYYGTNPDALGAAGGSQSHILTQAELSIALGTATSVVTDPGHVHNETGATAAGGVNSITKYAGTGGASTGSASDTVSATTGITVATTITNSLGGNAHSIVQPTITMNYIIKVSPDTSLSIANVVSSIGGMTGAISCGSGILCADNTISASSSIPGDPTALVGLTAINGVANSYMRSDAAPALDQAITPTWTGLHTFSNSSGGKVAASAPRWDWVETDASNNFFRWILDAGIFQLRYNNGTPSTISVDSNLKNRTTIQNGALPSTADELALLYVNRTASHSGGTASFVNSAIRAETTVAAGSPNFEWTGLALQTNNSTAADGSQNVAHYARMLRTSTGASWASVADANDNSEIANPTTGLYGLEVDISANGTDDNDTRRGVDIIGARSNTGGADTVIGYGLIIQPKATDAGHVLFKKGITLTGGTGTFTTGIDLTGAGTFGNTAILLATEQPINFDSARSLRVSSGNFVFKNSSGAGDIAFIGNGSLTLGVAGTVGGSVILRGSTSGAGTLSPPAIASTYTWSLPSASGTLAISAGATIPTIAQGDILYGSAADTLAVLAKDTGTSRFLKNSGTSNNPAWAQPAASDLSNGVTGTGSVALSNTPTFVSPVLGNATGTSVNVSGDLIGGPGGGSGAIRFLGSGGEAFLQAGTTKGTSATYLNITGYNGTGTQPIRANTTNGQVRIGGNSNPAFPLDVTGDVNSSGVYRVAGAAGLSVTKTVRDSAGTGTCTLIFTGGILTGGTC